MDVEKPKPKPITCADFIEALATMFKYKIGCYVRNIKLKNIGLQIRSKVFVVISLYEVRLLVQHSDSSNVTNGFI